jgi:hypothetical protein
MRDSLKRELEESAANAGRSLSEEIEFGLEQLLRERDELGGRELHGLLKLLVGAADIIQARTGEPPFSDWDTWKAGQMAWKKLIAETAPKPPADFIQYVETADEFPERPDRPKPPPVPCLPGFLGEVLADPDSEEEPYRTKMAAYETALRKYDKLMAKYQREVEARQRETQKWIERTTQYGDLGRSVAAELFPNREAVMQTALPLQRLEKSKEK